MQVKQNTKIFVQIASYRDPQLLPTVHDLLEKAKKPENLTFGICWQYGEDEDITALDNKKNFRIKKYHYSESQGLGWARAETNSLYNNEDLTLQLDSHHKFAEGWDTMMMEDYQQALSLSEKPVLTTYLTPFEYLQESLNPAPCLMSQYEFSSDKLLMSRPYYIQDFKSRSNIIKARTISGHFYLVEGNFINEVPYDPDIYFGGYTEETTLSIRAYTYGYDFYSPYRQYIWHEYTRANRPKHWEDHGTTASKGYAATKKTSLERDVYARNKTRQLFQQEEHNINMHQYGLGSVRTLRDYEIYGGFDFKKCRIQDYTLRVIEPPNPPDWENQFISYPYAINCEWDLDFFKEHNFKKPKFMTFGIQNNSGAEIFRHDFTLENNINIVNLKTNSYLAKFNSIDKPDKIVMYLFDEEKEWSKRYEKTLSV